MRRWLYLLSKEGKGFDLSSFKFFVRRLLFFYLLFLLFLLCSSFLLASVTISSVPNGDRGVEAAAARAEVLRQPPCARGPVTQPVGQVAGAEPFARAPGAVAAHHDGSRGAQDRRAGPRARVDGIAEFAPPLGAVSRLTRAQAPSDAMLAQVARRGLHRANASARPADLAAVSGAEARRQRVALVLRLQSQRPQRDDSQAQVQAHRSACGTRDDATGLLVDDHRPHRELLPPGDPSETPASVGIRGVRSSVPLESCGIWDQLIATGVYEGDQACVGGAAQARSAGDGVSRRFPDRRADARAMPASHVVGVEAARRLGVDGESGQVAGASSSQGDLPGIRLRPDALALVRADVQDQVAAARRQTRAAGERARHNVDPATDSDRGQVGGDDAGDAGGSISAALDGALRAIRAARTARSSRAPELERDGRALAHSQARPALGGVAPSVQRGSGRRADSRVAGAHSGADDRRVRHRLGRRASSAEPVQRDAPAVVVRDVGLVAGRRAAAHVDQPARDRSARVDLAGVSVAVAERAAHHAPVYPLGQHVDGERRAASRIEAAALGARDRAAHSRLAAAPDLLVGEASAGREQRQGGIAVAARGRSSARVDAGAACGERVSDTNWQPDDRLVCLTAQRAGAAIRDAVSGRARDVDGRVCAQLGGRDGADLGAAFRAARAHCEQDSDREGDRLAGGAKVADQTVFRSAASVTSPPLDRAADRRAPAVQHALASDARQAGAAADRRLDRARVCDTIAQLAADDSSSSDSELSWETAMAVEARARREKLTAKSRLARRQREASLRAAAASECSATAESPSGRSQRDTATSNVDTPADERALPTRAMSAAPSASAFDESEESDEESDSNDAFQFFVSTNRARQTSERQRAALEQTPLPHLMRRDEERTLGAARAPGTERAVSVNAQRECAHHTSPFAPISRAQSALSRWDSAWRAGAPPLARAGQRTPGATPSNGPQLWSQQRSASSGPARRISSHFSSHSRDRAERSGPTRSVQTPDKMTSTMACAQMRGLVVLTFLLFRRLRSLLKQCRCPPVGGSESTQRRSSLTPMCVSWSQTVLFRVLFLWLTQQLSYC